MLGGNNGNPVLPAFLNENRFQYQTNASNQLQLFGSCESSSASLSISIYIFFFYERLDSVKYVLLLFCILLFIVLSSLGPVLLCFCGGSFASG